MRKIIIIAALVIAAIVFVPMIANWGVNELLAQAGSRYEIPFNFRTWAAYLAIAMLFSGSGRSK